MKNIKTFESFLNEGKEFSFTFDYNTDEDDIEYIQSILKKAGVNATAEADLDSELMLVKAANAIELRKAQKAIEADGFQINEAMVQVAGSGKPAGATVLAKVILDFLSKEKHLTPAADRQLIGLEDDIEQLIMDSTF